MNLPYFAIRLLTLLCYFLPFIFFLSTCTDGRTSKEAFNKPEAIQNEQERTDNKLKEVDSIFLDTAASRDISIKKVKDLMNRSDHTANLDQDDAIFFLTPTNYSLSGIGVIYHHKNILGSVLMGVSLGISFITLVLWPFLKKKKWTLMFLEANIVVNVAFFVDCVATDVSLLYGFYVLMFLLLVQIGSELQNQKTT